MKGRARKRKEAAVEPRDQAEEAKILYSGFTRDLKIQEKYRDAIEKFDQDVRLSDAELESLLKFYVGMIAFTDITGQRYYVVHSDLIDRHRRLIQMAAERGWTQALINMWGKRAASIFDRL